MVLFANRLRLFLLLFSIGFIAGCDNQVQTWVKEAELRSKAPSLINLQSHATNEISQKQVVVDLIGRCGNELTGLQGSLNEAQISSFRFQDVSIASLLPGQASGSCKNGVLRVSYSVLDPNEERILNFVITPVSGFSEQNIPQDYKINYVRPEVPAPVILTRSGLSFSTFETTPTLDGICIAPRVTSLEYRVDGGPWSPLSCVETNPADPNSIDTWSVTLSSMSGNPSSTHLFEIRAANSNSIKNISAIRSLEVTIDTVPPEASPSITGTMGPVSLHAKIRQRTQYDIKLLFKMSQFYSLPETSLASG